MRLGLIAAIVWLFLSPVVRAETLLLMAEEPGCVWCARWNEEVSPVYPMTAEGKAAPLRRFDIRDGAPAGIALDSKLRFTPTFVLVHEGEEQGRIEGYPGEDFFWGLLGQLIGRAGIDISG